MSGSKKKEGKPRQEGLPVVALLADTDKVSRVRAVAAGCEQGAAYHLRGARWLEAR